MATRCTAEFLRDAVRSQQPAVCDFGVGHPTLNKWDQKHPLPRQWMIGKGYCYVRLSFSDISRKVSNARNTRFWEDFTYCTAASRSQARGTELYKIIDW